MQFNMNARVRRAINVTAQQSRLLINAVVGLSVTRIVLAELGHQQYANIAVVLSVVSIMGILGNALSGASARYVTQSLANQKFEEATRYLSNSIAALVLVAVSLAVTISALVAIRSTIFGALPLPLILCTLVGVLLNCVGGVFRVGNFYRERFLTSAFVFAASRVIYGLTAWFCITSLGFGVWGIAVGSLLGGVFVASTMKSLFSRLLPEISFSYGSISRECIREVCLFVGWMMLVYVGIYLITSGVLVIARNLITDDVQLSRLALSFQIGGLTHQILSGFLVATSPTTYRALAKSDLRLATKMVERFLFMALLGGLTFGAVFALEGDALIQLWLGPRAPNNMSPVLIGAAFSFMVAAMSAPISVYMAGDDRVRPYGMLCLVEGFTAAVISYFIVRYTVASVAVSSVIWIAGFVGTAKIGATLLLFRSRFRFSPMKVYLTKGVLVCCVLFSSLLLHKASSHYFAGLIWIQVIAIILPTTTYVAARLIGDAPQSRRQKALAAS